MKGKKLSNVYSEQAMLEDAKAKGFDVVPVVSNIRESGRVNTYVDMIKYIIIGENTVGIVTKKGEVEEMCTPYHSVKRRLKKYTDYDVHMSDYDAACDYQYCGKWNDPFTEKSGGRLIWKQLWFVCRSRRIAVKRSKPPCGNRCYRHYVHRRYHKRQ